MHLLSLFQVHLTHSGDSDPKSPWADCALWMCLSNQGLCYLHVHISCHSLAELRSSQDCRGELHRGESRGVAQEEGMGPFTLVGLGGLLLTAPGEALARAGAPKVAGSVQLGWPGTAQHGCALCSRTWGEELLRLITPARAGLAGLFLTVLIEAGFLLTFTLLHHYRFPGFQPPR